MRIGYFGGSFDPPHRGHLAVASAAASAFDLDRILFVPTGYQPLKPLGAVAGYVDRLAMVALLCALANQAQPCGAEFIASNLEEPRSDGVPNYTVDTLTSLRAVLGEENRLYVLLGADAFLQLPTWRSPDILLSLADWIIVSRPGFDLARFDDLPFSPEQRRRIHLLPTLSDPTSATTLRRELAKPTDDASLTDSVPIPILMYIREHCLYQA